MGACPHDLIILLYLIMIYFQTNNQKFKNRFLAEYESYKTHQPVTFHCYDEINDCYDWSHEPEESIETLMDQHAIKLRETYDRIVMYWSGGTDSHTVYNVFKRNRLHIDEIIHMYTARGDIMFPMYHGQWLLDNHWDPTTKITIFDHYDLSKTRATRSNGDDWIFNNERDLLKYGNTVQGVAALFAISGSDYLNQKTAVIGSYEKPNIMLHQGRWYTRQSSNRVAHIDLDVLNVECFFLDPKINIKQSHMVKQGLKKLNFWKSFANIPYIEDIEPTLCRYIPGNHGYQIWSKLCGRHTELVFGASLKQKAIMDQFRLDTELRIDTGITHFQSGETQLTHMLQQQHPSALQYVRGFYSLTQEARFLEYLNQHVLREPNQVLNMHTIYSKPYYIGE